MTRKLHGENFSKAHLNKILGYLKNENATLFTSFAVAIVGGWFYSAAYIYSRSLWLPRGVHCIAVRLRG
jgi:membrane protease YdiL (CAAX protease family)